MNTQPLSLHCIFSLTSGFADTDIITSAGFRGPGDVGHVVQLLEAFGRQHGRVGSAVSGGRRFVR